MKRWRPRPSWCGPAQGTRQQRQNGGPWKTLAGVRRMRERPAGRCPRRRGSTAGEATQGAGRSLEGPALLSLGDLLEVTLAGELAALGRDQGWRRPHHRQEVGQGPGRRHSCPGWGRGRGRVYLEARLAGQGPRLEQGQGVHMAAAMTRTWACATTSLVETTAEYVGKRSFRTSMTKGRRGGRQIPSPLTRPWAGATPHQQQLQRQQQQWPPLQPQRPRLAAPQ